MDISYRWNPDKNRTLISTRGISFDDEVNAIDAGKTVDKIAHPNSKKYPNQQIIYVSINDYVYMVPCVENKNEVFLKTIIPSRKANKKYNKKEPK